MALDTGSNRPPSLPHTTTVYLGRGEGGRERGEGGRGRRVEEGGGWIKNERERDKGW